MPWSDFNIAQGFNLYWEIIPLIICYIKLNVRNENYIHETNRRWQHFLWLVVAFLVLSLSSLITVTKQMNTVPSDNDILASSQKPENDNSCPCVILSLAPLLGRGHCLLSAEPKALKERRGRSCLQRNFII